MDSPSSVLTHAHLAKTGRGRRRFYCLEKLTIMAILYASPPSPPYIRKRGDPVYKRPFCWFCAIERRTWIKTGAECIIRSGIRKKHQWHYPTEAFVCPGKYILKNRKPVEIQDLYRWGRWMESAKRRVRKTTLPNNIDVSTIFLGLEHNFGMDGAPIVFETMVFRGDDGGGDERRYTTYADAVAGHKKIVQAIKDGKC